MKIVSGWFTKIVGSQRSLNFNYLQKELIDRAIRLGDGKNRPKNLNVKDVLRANGYSNTFFGRVIKNAFTNFKTLRLTHNPKKN